MSCNHADLCIIAFVDDDFRCIIHWELLRDEPVRTTTEALRQAMQAFQPTIQELKTNNIDLCYVKAHPPSQYGKMERFWRTLDPARTVQSMQRFSRGSSTNQTIIHTTRRSKWLLPKSLSGCLCRQRLASLMKSPMS
jgi:transposase InsO family protein